jgi:hypothetical protein
MVLLRTSVGRLAYWLTWLKCRPLVTGQNAVR